MTWTEHLIEAQRLGRQRAAANLAGLLTDHRVVGLVGYLDELERGFDAALVDKRMADRHGAMAHAAGAVYVLHLIRQHLAQIMAAKVKKPKLDEEPEETE